jgi:hypothetical protein
MYNLKIATINDFLFESIFLRANKSAFKLFSFFKQENEDCWRKIILDAQ